MDFMCDKIKFHIDNDYSLWYDIENKSKRNGRNHGSRISYKNV